VRPPEANRVELLEPRLLDDGVREVGDELAVVPFDEHVGDDLLGFARSRLRRTDRLARCRASALPAKAEEPAQLYTPCPTAIEA
jgi:hypothetical protein